MNVKSQQVQESVVKQFNTKLEETKLYLFNKLKENLQTIFNIVHEIKSDN